MLMLAEFSGHDALFFAVKNVITQRRKKNAVKHENDAMSSNWLGCLAGTTTAVNGWPTRIDFRVTVKNQPRCEKRWHPCVFWPMRVG